MGWTAEERLDAAIRGPMGPGLYRPDTRVIEREGWYQVVTPSTQGPTLNEVLFSQVGERDADRIIDETIALYRDHGLPVKWCVGPWTKPLDFGQRLERRGFSSWEVRGMVASTSMTIAIPEDVVVEEVDESSLDRYLQTFISGWSLPAGQSEAEGHLAALRASPRIAHFFSAVVGGSVAGTCGLLLRDRYAYFVGAMTLPSHRSRGLYRAMVGARLAFLEARGIDLAVTHARQATSAPILERLGFETAFRSKCYLLTAD